MKDWQPAAAFQAISRIGRKPKPVVYIDMETRSTLSLDPGARGDVICGAYKIGDGPVRTLPWDTVPVCRGRIDPIPRDSRGMVDMGRVTWQREEERKHRHMMADIRVQQQVDYYQDLAFLAKPWLTRKFLTLAARARTLLKR